MEEKEDCGKGRMLGRVRMVKVNIGRTLGQERMPIVSGPWKRSLVVTEGQQVLLG